MDIESILAGKGREVRTIMPDATIAEAVDRMRKEWIGALVVSEDGARIAGIISDRGIMNAIADHGVAVMNERVHSVMTKEVFTCVSRDRVSAIMAAMTIRRIRHIPVVEKNGRLCGIVSIADVVKHRLDEIQRTRPVRAALRERWAW
jgi:CBS domain-containing protein